MSTVGESVAEAMDRQYRQQVERTVDRLRRMADEVERAALNVRADTGPMRAALPYTYAAQQAVKEVMWGLANANLDSVVRAAGDADRYNVENPS